MKRLFLILLIISVLICCSKTSADKPKEIEYKKKKIFVTRVPSMDPRILMQELLPLKKYLSNWLEMEVVFVFEKDYKTILDKVKDYPYDIVFFGPKSYVKAHKIAGYKALIKAIRNKKSVYHGAIIINKDSEIWSLKDLEGQTIGFVNKDSSSGYVYPTLLFLKNGIRPKHFFSDIQYLGSHDKVVWAVFKQKIDAGCVFDGAIEDTFKDAPYNIKHLRTIARTDPIPNAPIAVSPKLDKELIEKISEAFLNLNKTIQGKLILNKIGTTIDGYEKAEDSDYDIVREAMEKVKD